MDVNDVSTIQTAFETIMQQQQHIDMIINNAGIELFGPLVEVDIEKFRLQMETNVTAPLVMRFRKKSISIKKNQLKNSLPLQSNCF